MGKRKITVKGERVKERILAKALQLFNSDGIEYVGVREIATALNMRAGHVTYYFPSKEDIVLALSQGLRALNDTTVPSADTRTIADFLSRFERILRNHITYRCLLLSMARLLTQLPKVKAFYRTTQQKREDDLRLCLRALVEAGELRVLDSSEEDHLISCCSLISRGWLVETIAAGHDPEERITHYNGLLERLLAPYRARS